MQFKYSNNEEEVRQFILSLSQKPFVALDTETTGLDPKKDRLVDVQVGCPTTGYLCFDASHSPLLLSLPTSTSFVGHHLKFDLNFLYRAGVNLLDRPFRDTMLIHHLIDENAAHDLDSLIKERWNDSYKEVFWSTYNLYTDASPLARAEYACKDVHYTFELFKQLLHEYKAQDLPLALIDHTHKLQKTLLQTEIEGISLDIEYLMDAGVKLQSQINSLLPQMREAVKEEIDLLEVEYWNREIDKRVSEKGKARVVRPEFSFDSPKQMQELLYGKMGMPEQVGEKTKRPTVDDAALERLVGISHHPVLELIRSYRGYNKTYNTYVQGTLELVHEGRIYPEFNVNGTVTGRISHKNPNLGNLPRDGGIRGMYTPDPEYVFISADYSSLEVVIEAHLTHDKNLVRILQEGVSKHDITAKELQIDRNLAKTLNFAAQYHCSAWKISKLLGVSIKEAEKIHKRYWEIYSGPRDLKAQTDKEVDQFGYIWNMVGRKRRFGLMKRQEWSGDYREAYNFKIQGPGADFTHQASYIVDEELKRKKLGKFVVSIHDEIMIQAKKEQAKEAEYELIKAMESINKKWALAYPLKAIGSGPMERWE